MAMFKRIKQRGKEFGFGNNTIGKDQRILNKDGSFNVDRKGLSFFDRFSFFHWMINTKSITFLFFVFIGFFLYNTFFSFLYYFVLGAEQFHGIESNTELSKFFELFFFSSQTFATVGYGRVNPATNWASLVAAIDAFWGVLYIAIVTGLLYGRFSKPIPKVMFSEKGVVAPYKEGMAIMFRLANKLNHQLKNAEVRLIVALTVDVEGYPNRQYFELELEHREIIFLATSWTIVHPIDDKSPFFNMTQNEFYYSEPEFMMQLKVYDNSYSQDTFTNTSYRKEEIIWNARFEKILVSENSINYVDFTKFNEITNLK